MSNSYIYEDALGLFGKDKLGLAEKRLVIVAQNTNVPDIEVWIEAVPAFNQSQTEVVIGFTLNVRRKNEQQRHTSISPGVVESALKEGRMPISAAAADQYPWLTHNFEELSGPILQAHQQRTVAPAPPSGRDKFF